MEEMGAKVGEGMGDTDFLTKLRSIPLPIL
jgi:hypothetical protein